MLTLEVTSAERAAGALTEARLQAAMTALREDGCLALEGVVKPAHLATIGERMQADLPAILAREDAPYNFNRGNVQQMPPPFPPYLFADVVANDLIVSITEAVLGPGVQNGFYSGNTALPGEFRQPVHVDSGQLWPGLTVAPPAYGMVVNLPVVDMSPENGAVELWPGTHRDTALSLAAESIVVPEAAQRRYRESAAPLQPTLACGGALIRDLRLWHRGMPNWTATARPMLAMIHYVRWWRAGRLTFPRGTEAIFAHPRLRTAADFVEGPVEYLGHGRAYDYAG